MDAVRELIRTSSYGRTTIDQICEKAAVKKGSFYHFFNDKADLATQALEANWAKTKQVYDSIFSPTVPPLERIRHYCEYIYRSQVDLKGEYGKVLGCSLCALGSEVCTQEVELRRTIQEMMEMKRKYLESAIREAHALGLLSAPDPTAKTRMIYAYHDGLLTEARILNDVEVLHEIADHTLEMLGATPKAADREARRELDFTK